tara:strand:- start:721 stop:1002 length:282 start_codon:yes stop_codon:yes gene_type:complete
MLEMVDLITGKMMCKNCGFEQEFPPNDNIVDITFHGEGKREITIAEATRLMSEPTTAKRNIKCQECDNTIMSVIRDENYNYKLGCRKCEKIFY